MAENTHIAILINPLLVSLCQKLWKLTKHLTTIDSTSPAWSSEAQGRTTTSGSQLTTLQNKDVSVYDAVTIFIGTNDYGYNTSIATFKSNIAAMVDYITAQNPACKIGFLTLIHRASACDGTAEVPNYAGAVLSDYCTAIKEFAMTYGLPVLDLWNECQCNFNFSIYKTNYYRRQVKRAVMVSIRPTRRTSCSSTHWFVSL